MGNSQSSEQEEKEKIYNEKIYKLQEEIIDLKNKNNAQKNTIKILLMQDDHYENILKLSQSDLPSAKINQ